MELRKRQSGVALVAALWLLVLMSLITSTMAWSNRHSIKSMSAITGAVQARHLAEGAFQLAYANLLVTDPASRLLADGEIIELQLPGGHVDLRISDEHGKVDINGAAAALLARLLYSLDVETPRADALADAIVDYRDPDDLRHLNGAEDADYEAAGMPWKTRGAFFTSVDELRKVYGMDEITFAAIRPYVTTHTRQKGINPEVASLPVLMAVSDESVFSLENYVLQRRLNHSNGLPLPKPPTIDRRFLSRIKGITYNLTGMGRTAKGHTAGLSTTIGLRRNRRGAQIQVHTWSPYMHVGTLRESDGAESNSIQKWDEHGDN